MEGEHMKSAINSYLKRRYLCPERSIKTESTSTQSAQQMALMALIDKDVTRSNSITYSNIANDSGQVESQFAKLKSWVADLKVESYRNELANLLCPLFCHLYLEMLCGNQRGNALKFFKRYQVLFASKDNCHELLEALAMINNSDDIEQDPYIKAFRSAKYQLRISTQGLVILQKYLSDHGHVLILQTMQKWFDFEIVPSLRSEVEEEEDDDDDDDDDTSTPKNVKAYTCVMKEENSPSVLGSNEGSKGLENVLKAIKAVRDSPSPLLLYVISDPYHKALCCATTESVSMLAVGVGNCIKLWGLTEKLKGAEKPSTIPMSTGQTSAPLCNSTTVGKSFLSQSTHLEDTKKNINSASVSLYGHSAAVNDIAFISKCEDPGVVLSVSRDCTMRSWRLDSYDNVAVYRGHSEEIWCLDVSSLGIYVITGSHDRTIRLWSLERNFPLRTCAGHLLDVECLAFHPNNLYFASGSADETVRMWSVNDAKLLRLFHGHRGAIHAVAFSPDGKYLASAGEDKKLKIWDLAGGKLLKECKGHTNTIKSISWSRNNENIASCSLDGTVRLWNLQNRPESSESAASSDLLQTFTVGKALLSVLHSKTNNLVCFATA